MEWVADVVDRANKLLSDRHAAIGPSYFMKDKLDEEMVSLIWEHNVLPYVEEQLYGEHGRMDEFNLDKLRSDVDGAADSTDEDRDDQESAPASDDASDLSIVIEPKLDISRVIFLASYAMGAFDLRDEGFDFEDAPSLVEDYGPCTDFGGPPRLRPRIAAWLPN